MKNLFKLDFKFLKEWRWRPIKLKDFSKMFGILILSIFISLAFSELISDWVIGHAHYKTIKIISAEWMVDNDDKGRIVCSEGMCEAVVSNEGFELISIEDDTIFFKPLYEGAEISFELPVYPNIHMTFELGAEDGNFLFVVDDIFKRSIGFEREQHSIDYYFYSFPDLIYIYVWYIFYYIIIACFIFLLINIILKISKKVKKDCLLYNKEKVVCFIAISSIYFLYVSINYYLNYDLFQVGEGADAFYYMYPSYQDTMGSFSLQTYINTTMAFRGCLQHIIAIIGNGISTFFSVDVMYFYFFLWSILLGYSICFIIPSLYEVIFKKKISVLSPIAFFVLFMLFWRAHTFYFLSDIPASFFALDAVVFVVKALKEDKEKKYLLLAGVHIGIAAGFRSAYSYFVYAFLIICICKELFLHKKLAKKDILKGIQRGIIFYFGIILVLWPQFIVNKERGAIGFFPYDGGFVYDVDNAEVYSLMESSFTSGLHEYQFMAKDDADQQFKTIYNDLYEGKNRYKIKDMLFIILDHPKEFFSGYLKKLFWALSAGYETAYGALPISNWELNLIIILNYFMLWNVLSHMIIGKYHKKDQECLINTILLSGILLNVIPQSLLHIERRYFMFFYLLIYLYNSVFLIESKNWKRVLNFRYLVGGVFFCAFCYAFRVTIQLNFV